VIKNKSMDGTDYNVDLQIKTSTESVLFYPAILNICVSNLVENSLIFNKSQKIKICISAELSNQKLILSVKDNGIGIPKAQQNEIFNMFKRTSQTSTGNGLGLYLVKKATEKLNGQIQLKSESHKGSTFTITLPLE